MIKIDKMAAKKGQKFVFLFDEPQFHDEVIQGLNIWVTYSGGNAL